MEAADTPPGIATGAARDRRAAQAPSMRDQLVSSEAAETIVRNSAMISGWRDWR